MKIKFVLQNCCIGLSWKNSITRKNLQGPYLVKRTYFLCPFPFFTVIWSRYSGIKKEKDNSYFIGVNQNYLSDIEKERN